MASLPTLAKVAGCGAIMVAGAFSYTQWKIEEGLKRGTWYGESLRLLRAHRGAAGLLGEPIVDGRLDLGSNNTNFCDQTRAQFRVPVKGPKQNGYLYLQASRADGAWTVDRLELELAADTTRKLLVHVGEAATEADVAALLTEEAAAQTEVVAAGTAMVVDS